MSDTGRLSSGHSALDLEPHELTELRRERIYGLCFLAVVGVCTVLDMVEDGLEGTSLTHISVEAAVALTCFTAGIFLWRRIAESWTSQAAELKAQLGLVNEDAARWRQQTAALSAGLGEAIDQQLGLWKLSGAEKEVAILLIKGLSLKEISQVRNTAERTVRLQAASVYRKAGLEGRAQLAAFFLEDLLIPVARG